MPGSHPMAGKAGSPAKRETPADRAKDLQALRRARMAHSPPFLRGGFRPFFFAGAAWAIVALILWLGALFNAWMLPSLLDPLVWHRHEMFFGFIGTVIAGFLLTAIPNWTGRLPIAGGPLALLAGLWLAGRLAVLFSAYTGALTAAVVDGAFYGVLAAAAGREVIAARNRNLPVVGLVLLFGLANALDHAAAAGLLGDPDLGWRAAMALVVVLISLIGGRIIPSFTRNWMTKQGFRSGFPRQPSRFDLAVIAVTGLALIGWIAAPGRPEAAWILLAAGLLQLLRLAQWRGWRTLSEPLVLILHVGYLWLPAGLLLLGATGMGAPVPESAAIHALTAGAMGTMILAVMTRATLGHTGRKLTADAATVLAYILVTGGALVRVVTPLGIADHGYGMSLAAALWAGAFLIFLGTCGPMLFTARADTSTG